MINMHAPVLRRQLHVGPVVAAVEVLAHSVEAVQAVEDVWAGEDGGVLLATVRSEADRAGCLGVLVKSGSFRSCECEVASWRALVEVSVGKDVPTMGEGIPVCVNFWIRQPDILRFRCIKYDIQGAVGMVSESGDEAMRFELNSALRIRKIGGEASLVRPQDP